VAVTDGVGVAVTDAADPAAVGDEVKVTTRPGIASHATKRIAKSRLSALILLG
jgi:hypothetical protein